MLPTASPAAVTLLDDAAESYLARAATLGATTEQAALALERAAARMGAIVHFADLRRGEGLSIHSPLKLAAAYQEVMER